MEKQRGTRLMTLERVLARDPLHPGANQYGLTQSLRAQKKAARAVRIERRFEAAWKNAEVRIAGSEF